MTTTKPALMDEWSTLPWKKIELSVFKLQQRIYRASERGDVKTIHNSNGCFSTHGRQNYWRSEKSRRTIKERKQPE
jgi:hypothetical protein